MINKSIESEESYTETVIRQPQTHRVQMDAYGHPDIQVKMDAIID